MRLIKKESSAATLAAESSSPVPAAIGQTDPVDLHQGESPTATPADHARAKSGRSPRRGSSHARWLEKRLLATQGRSLTRLTPAQAQLRTILAQTRFLREFSICGNVLRSAQAAGVGRRVVYSWRDEDPSFARKMAEAHEDALDALEEEARRRGADGVLEPVFQGGHKVGSVRKYSDNLLMMFLKGKRRADFSERVEQTGPNGAPLAPAVVLVSWHHSMKPPEQP